MKKGSFFKRLTARKKRATKGMVITMSKLFPSMCSKPENGRIVALFPCWLWIFVLVPMFMPFLGAGLWEQPEVSVWLEIVYHIVNGLVMLFLISGYLKDEWFMVTTEVKHYLKHVLLTVGLILGAELILLGFLSVCGYSIGGMLDHLPVTEMTVSHTPLFTVDLEPIFGTLVFTVFTPFSICALFYCLGFAPICYKRPWLAYLCVAVITLIPPAIDIFWRGNAELMLNGYFVRLPVHLLACWSYQKTDNVWTPILSLAGANLLFSVAIPLLLL